jgi:threonine/homoserine/homoserine lactone efflux protein
MTLGLLFDAVGTAWNIAVACFAGRLAASRTYGQLKTWIERTMGALFVLAGIKFALTEHP